MDRGFGNQTALRSLPREDGKVMEGMPVEASRFDHVAEAARFGRHIE